MSNGFQEGAVGGISFSTPAFSFGNTSPAVNGGFSFDLPLASLQAFSNQALSFTSNNSANNRGFLGGVISTAQGQLTGVSQQASAFQARSLDMFGAMSGQLQQTLQDTVKTTTRKGCFITTAVCRDTGEADDCDVLQTLRGFRDGYMRMTPEGKGLVEMYYQIAPDIVSAIDARDDSRTVYAVLREGFILPAVQAIKQGENRLALDLYRQAVNTAQEYAAETVGA